MFHSHLITFFILILLHTVSKIGMYDLLYSVLYECVDTRSFLIFEIIQDLDKIKVGNVWENSAKNIQLSGIGPRQSS